MILQYSLIELNTITKRHFDITVISLHTQTVQNPFKPVHNNNEPIQGPRVNSPLFQKAPALATSSRHNIL